MWHNSDEQFSLRSPKELTSKTMLLSVQSVVNEAACQLIKQSLALARILRLDLR